MIACFAWTNTQIINITNAKINLYSEDKADLYIRMGGHISNELIAAVKKSGAYENIYSLDPININYNKLTLGFVPDVRVLFLKSAYKRAYAALLGHLCGEKRYERVLLAWFFTENAFLLDYWSRFTDRLAITFVDEGTGSYCYTKKQICFPQFMANTFKARVKRYITEGGLARKFAKNIDSFCLYRPEYCRPDIDFQKLTLPVIKEENNPVMYKILCDAVAGLDHTHFIRYEKRDMLYFSTYSPEGKEFDLRSLEILETVIKVGYHKNVIAKIHMGNSAHGNSFARSYEDQIFVDRENYIFEGLFVQLPDLNKKVMVSCASTATINPKFMFGEEPYVIFTYRLYDTYRQCGVERDDWIASALMDSYEDKSKVLIPNSMYELKEMLKQICGQQARALTRPGRERLVRGHSGRPQAAKQKIWRTNYVREENRSTIIAIVQAHMSSTRLPGKIMMDLHGKPILYRVIERARQSKYIRGVVVATSTLPCDDQIVSACEAWGVDVFRGSDSDVLSRYWGAAQAYPADVYMRLTSDNPLIDPRQIDEAVEFFLAHDYRYVHTDGKLPLGGGEEIFTAELMKEAAECSTEPFEHEHVTPYMYWKQTSVGEVPSKRDGSKYRITVDTPEDYEVVSRIYQALFKGVNDFTLDEIIDYLDAHPEVAAINSMIVQKKATD